MPSAVAGKSSRGGALFSTFASDRVFAYNADSDSVLDDMTDPLAKLFGSPARLKLLRLFLFNPLHSFTTEEAATRTQIEVGEARRQAGFLAASGLLKRNRRGKQLKYEVNNSFPYIRPLQDLLLNVESRELEVKDRLKGVGTIKLIIVAGLFMGQWESEIDLLVVGDKIKDRAFKAEIKKLEAEIGKEVRYVLLSSQDFLYRLNMSDRLMRDIFDFPHRIVLDKFDIGLK
jgi:hypothetical protein